MEGTFEFLVVFLRAHLGAGRGQLGGRDHPGQADRAQGGEPFGLALFLFRLRHGLQCTGIQAVKAVAALRRADEDRPAASVGQRRAHDLGPDAAGHHGEFVEHYAVEIDAQLGFPRRRVRQGGGEVLHVIPRDLLRLAVERRDIGEARHVGLAAQGAVDHLVDGQHGLAEPAVADQHVEAFHGEMKHRLPGARIVARANAFLVHRAGFPYRQ